MSKLLVFATGLLVFAAGLVGGYEYRGHDRPAAETRPAYCNADTYNAVLPALNKLLDDVEVSQRLALETDMRDRHLRGTSADFAQDARIYQQAVAFASARLRECVQQ